MLTSNEPVGMTEDTSRDTGHLRELIVPQTTPCSGHAAAVVETGGRDRHSLDAPLALALVLEEAEQNLLAQRKLLLQLGHHPGKGSHHKLIISSSSQIE